MAKKTLLLSQADGYRFVEPGGRVTAVLEASGKITLKDGNSSLEVFESWSDFVKSMGETPISSNVEADVLAQLSSMGLGEAQAINVTSGRQEREDPTMAEAKEGKVKSKIAEVDAVKKANAAKKVATKKAAPAKKEKKPIELHDCNCGCGTQVVRDFRQGHDAKAHGIFKKVERGELTLSSQPPILQKWLKEHGVKPNSVKVEAKPKAKKAAKAPKEEAVA